MNRQRQVWDRKLKSKLLGLARLRSRFSSWFCKCNDSFPPCRLWEEKISAQFCGPHLRWGAHEHNHVWRMQNGEWRSCWGLTAKTRLPAFKWRLRPPSSGPQAPFAAGTGPLSIGRSCSWGLLPWPTVLSAGFQRVGPATTLTLWCSQWIFSSLLRFLFWLVKVSLVHESFLDLSLPVLDDQVRVLSSFYLSWSFSSIDFTGEPCHHFQVWTSLACGEFSLNSWMKNGVNTCFTKKRGDCVWNSL